MKPAIITFLLLLTFARTIYAYSFSSEKSSLTVSGGTLKNTYGENETGFVQTTYRAENITAGAFYSSKSAMLFAQYQAQWESLALNAGHVSESFEYGFMISNRAFRHFYDTMPTEYPVGVMLTTGLTYLNITTGYYALNSAQTEFSEKHLARINLVWANFMRLSAGTWRLQSSGKFSPWYSGQVEHYFSSVKARLQGHAEVTSASDFAGNLSLSRQHYTLSLGIFRHREFDPFVAQIYNEHTRALQINARAGLFSAQIFQSEQMRQMTVKTHSSHFRIWWQHTNSVKSITGAAYITNPDGLHARFAYYDTFSQIHNARQFAIGSGYADVFRLTYIFLDSSQEFMPVDPLLVPTTFYSSGMLSDNYLYSRKSSHNLVLTSHIDNFSAMAVFSQTRNYHSHILHDILFRISYSHTF